MKHIIYSNIIIPYHYLLFFTYKINFFDKGHNLVMKNFLTKKKEWLSKNFFDHFIVLISYILTV